MSPEEAFRHAVRDLGDVSLLERFFDDVAAENRQRTDGMMAPMKARIELVRNYGLAAWRNIARHPFASVLNVAGLGLGMAAVLLIGLFILQSLSVDRYIPDVDRIFRTSSKYTLSDAWRSRASRSLAPILRNEWSAAESVTVVEGRYHDEQPFSIGDDVQFEAGVIRTDEHFLEMFGHRVLAQGSEVPLARRGSVVLTASTAKKWFGSTDPIGQSVRFRSTLDLVVDAVIADPPVNTHLPFNVLVRTLPTEPVVDWRYGGRMYVKLAPGADGDALTGFLENTWNERSPMGSAAEFRLQPMTSVYLDSRVVDDYASVGDMRYLLIFGTIGMLILILAIINYTNLATAQALRRAREVGIRQVVGATKGMLRTQFLSEAVAIALLSVIPALLLVYITLPYIGQITGQTIPFAQALHPGILVSLLTCVVVTGLAAGSYPALLLSRLRPMEVFSGGKSPAAGRHRVKRLLVGIQVTVSLAMIAASAVVSGQLDFIREMNLGFDQSHVVSLSVPGWSTAQYMAFEERLETSPHLVSVASGIPAGIGYQSSYGTRPATDDRPEVHTSIVHVGPGYFDTMKIDLLNGRAFRWEDQAVDPPPVVVTRSWERVFSPDESMLGKPSRAATGWPAGDVVGIVEDVFNRSIHNEDQTVAFIMQPKDLAIRVVLVRLSEDRIDEGLGVLRNIWKEIEPEHVFHFAFLDDQIQRQYAAETRLARAFDLFSGVSIFIALLGLFGLATLTARQRRAEIGIRKVLGASIPDVVRLLTKEFVHVVLFGAVLTMPLVYVYGNRWLNNFAHHIEIGPALLLWTTTVVLVLVLVAVGVQSVRAAMANPVDSIRHN